MSEKIQNVKPKKKSFGAGWLFADEDETANDSKSSPSESTIFTQNNASNSNNNANSNNFTNTFQTAATRDPRIEEKLKATLKAANLPGPDYFEFRQQLEVLKSVIPDEKTRFAAAYSSLTVQGIDKSRILESASHYVKLLNGENGKFESAIASRSDEKINLKEKEALALTEENKTLQAQISQLNGKISENLSKISTLGEEVSKAKNEIEDAKQRFQVTLSGFIDDIQKDAQKVGIYIQ